MRDFAKNWPMQEAIKQNLRDPDSFEQVSTTITPVDKNEHHYILMTYRARNGFGGMNVEQAIGVVDHESCKLLELKM